MIMEMDVTESPPPAKRPSFFFSSRSVILKSHFTKTADFIEAKGEEEHFTNASATFKVAIERSMKTTDSFHILVLICF